MSYKVEFKQDALADLEKIDRAIAQRILNKMKWLAENFEETIPQPLTAELKGLFRFRVGDYRIVYALDNRQKLLTIHLIGHRKEIYR